MKNRGKCWDSQAAIRRKSLETRSKGSEAGACPGDSSWWGEEMERAGVKVEAGNRACWPYENTALLQARRIQVQSL